ncbi:beta-galactosidase [Butyrivibrio sp. INlla18]|uniref:glycoside hydrolase family 2 protein n=1 Tax=Butyrivibrio sp. INlla18 TaxID=1520806 RepID=UPI00088D8E4B|nr:glycoside hydrolase family 2 TIM barrel-domain containing protein [Butyrivibrio sp. INlla18]SDA38870.1 beta-galactosidase [Butyrivibrio sp. INlla18]
MRRVIDFNMDWQFHKGDISPEDIKNAKWDEIKIPHTWNNLDGQDGGNDYYQGKSWYRKNLGKELIPSGFDKDVYIRFGAASKRAEVYLNGEMVGCHDGGFASFTIRLTDKLTYVNDEILVMVDNSRDLPIYPMQADFTFFGGLYREISLICFDTTKHFRVDEYGVDSLFVTPKVDGTLNIETELQNMEKDVTFSAKIYELNGDSKELVKEIDELSLNRASTGLLEGSILLDDVALWNGSQDSNLYILEIGLGDRNCSFLLDELSTTFGFRSFNVDPDKGFFLNGRSYPLHGVCRHQDRENMGWAITKKEHDEDMELIKDIGANTVRLAHYQQAPYFYDLCDKNGIVVWAEIPFISVYDSRKEADENLLLQIKELVMQNYNHPSICFWGIANETGIGGESKAQYDILKKLNALVKELDVTRLTTMANFGGTNPDSVLFHSTDVASYNIYKGWYEGVAEDIGTFCDEMHRKLEGIPLGISEYGADAVLKWHSSDPKVKDYTEEYQAFVHETALKAFKDRSYLFGTWLWNMFDFAADGRDEGGCKGRNNKGLVTYDRKIKKDAFYIYKALWSKDPFVYICGKRFIKRCKDKIVVKVYSNSDAVQLYVNEKYFGERKDGEGSFVFENVPLSEGVNKIEARAFWTEADFERSTINDADRRGIMFSDTLIVEKVDSEPQEYIYKEDKNLSEAVTQWFAGITGSDEVQVKEIILNEGYLSVNDPLEVIYKYKEGYETIQELVIKPMALVNPSMAERMKTGGAMSFSSIWNHISKMFPDDLIYVVNERLNKIKK